jgi:hypothetical protein
MEATMYRMVFAAGGGAFEVSVVRGKAETMAEVLTAIDSMFSNGYESVTVVDRWGRLVCAASAWSGVVC